MSRVNKARALNSPAPVPPAPVVKKKRVSRRALVTTVIVVIVALVATVITLAATVWLPQAGAQQQQEYASNMKQQVGIVNGQAFPLVLANSVHDTSSVNGAVILFVGSITSETQSNLRIGYKAPNGDSYILSVPVQYIVFHQEVGGTPSGKFYFQYWTKGDTLQGNIDRWFGTDNMGGPGTSKIVINLTPEQFQQLVKS